MRISVIGVGVQGSAIASVLTHVKDVSEIRCADIDLARVKRTMRKLSDSRVQAHQVDANDPSDVLKVTSRSDVVINAALPRFNVTVMSAALRSGSHYIDMASDDPLRQLDSYDEWKRAGLTAVITQGGPFVVNALVKSAVDNLDRIDEIRLRHGWRRLGERDTIHPWSPSWSPEVAISEWESPPIIYKDGEYQRTPTFSGMEGYRFPEPLGWLTVCSVDYEPVYTLPRLLDKGVRYVDCKIPPDLMAGALIKIGLASREPVEVKGTKIVPREVLMALTPQPADRDERPVLDSDVLLCYLAEVEGVKNGERQVHTLYRSFSASEDLKMFGVRWANIAVPVAVTALMLTKGEVESGVLPPEGLPPSFLTRLGEWGMTFQHSVMIATRGRHEGSADVP